MVLPTPTGIDTGARVNAPTVAKAAPILTVPTHDQRCFLEQVAVATPAFATTDAADATFDAVMRVFPYA